MATVEEQQAAALARWRTKRMDAQFGRNGATELIATQAVTMAQPQTYQLGQYVTMDRPILGFVLVESGRNVIGTNAYDVGVPESYTNLMQRVLIQGQHVLWGNTTPWDISGATLFTAPLMTQAPGGNTFLSSTTRQNNPGQPYVQSANLITTPATGTIDYYITRWMPTGPFLGGGTSSKRHLLPYYLRPEDWNGPLIFNVSMGDKTALGTPNAATTSTWTAFGSGGGTPQLQLFAVYAQLGDARYGYVPGSNAVMVRNEQPAPTLLLGATSQQTLLAQLQSYITFNVLVKTGINLTGTTAGVQAFSSLSDVQLDVTALKVGNTFLKNNGSNLAYKDGYLQVFNNTVMPQGYFPLSFVESGNPFTAYRADLEVTNNANFQIVTAVLSANANNRQQYMQEYALSASGQKGAQGPFLNRKV